VIIHYTPHRYRGGRQNFAARNFVRVWTGVSALVAVADPFWCALTGMSGMTSGGQICALGGND
jgi:hypothetical protein